MSRCSAVDTPLTMTSPSLFEDLLGIACPDQGLQDERMNVMLFVLITIIFLFFSPIIRFGYPFDELKRYDYNKRYNNNK